MEQVDLAIRGGTIVTSKGRRKADIGIKDGKIAAIGAVGSADREFDAHGLLVMPGGVDSHVHFMDPGDSEREDFSAGSAAAASVGVTTVVEHTHSHPIRSAEQLQKKVDHLQGRSFVDFGLAAHAWPGEAHEVPALWQAGVAFFKVFTCTTHGVPGHDAAALKTHLAASAAVGGVSLIHCEDESLTAAAEKELRGEGREDGAIVPEWRNRDAELIAATVAAMLIRQTGANASIAHVSNPEVASYLMAERIKGGNIHAEGCPQYFLLREEEVLDEGGLRKFTPPARARSKADEEEMWDLLRRGVLTHMSSDHAPSTLKQKEAGSIWDVNFGLPGVDSTYPILLDAAARGLLSYEDVARVYAEEPARLYGFDDRKGKIAVGLDADIALVDPNAHYTFTDEAVLSKAGWTPFAGRDVKGRVMRTFLRGVLIAGDGKTVDGHGGVFLPGRGVRTN